MDDTSQGHPAEDDVLVKLTSLLILGAGLLALFTGQKWFWLVFALGFAVLVPIVKVVTDEFGLDPATDGESPAESTRSDAPESKQDALDTLRDRYARGELTEAEFERKVERLLETETLEGARERVGRQSHDDAVAHGTPTENVETDDVR